MLETLRNIFIAPPFMPHGHCYFWEPTLLALHVISDALIAVSYVSIPVFLFYFARRRPDVPFRGVFLLFGSFIVMCGMTHVFDIITTWEPVYWLEGVVKFVTAGVSVATAVFLIPVIPRALSLRSPAALEEANARLRKAEREQSQTIRELEQANEKLGVALSELARNNQELERFAGAASHDLRAPLQGIEQMARLVAAEIEGDPARRDDARLAADVALIEERAHRLAAVVDDLLRWARAGTVTGQRERVSLPDIAEKTISLLDAPDGYEFELEIEVESLDAHRTALEQILRNLTENAIKHRGESGHRARISATHDGDTIVIAVEDDGPGIPFAQREDAIALFHGDTAGSRELSGMGLAIASRAAQGLGGTLQLADSDLGGLRAELRLPREPGPKPTPPSTAVAPTTEVRAELDEGDESSARARMVAVLVIEDDELERTLLSRAFERIGATTIEAATVEEARSKLAELDAEGRAIGALIDVHLPDGSGLDLLPVLREHTVTSIAPAFVRSGKVDRRLARAAYRSGTAAVFAKGEATPDEIAQHVVSTLELAWSDVVSERTGGEDG